MCFSTFSHSYRQNVTSCLKTFHIGPNWQHTGDSPANQIIPGLMQQPYWVHHKGGSVPSAFSSHSASCSSVHSADIRASWWHGACNRGALAGTLLSKNALSRCCTWTVCWVWPHARDLGRNRKERRQEEKVKAAFASWAYNFSFKSYAWLPT